MPILRQMTDGKSEAVYFIDPQRGINLREVRKIVNIALIGNVNCGLLLNGIEEEFDADVM